MLECADERTSRDGDNDSAGQEDAKFANNIQASTSIEPRRDDRVGGVLFYTKLASDLFGLWKLRR